MNKSLTRCWGIFPSAWACTTFDVALLLLQVPQTQPDKNLPYQRTSALFIAYLEKLQEVIMDENMVFCYDAVLLLNLLAGIGVY